MLRIDILSRDKRMEEREGGTYCSTRGIGLFYQCVKAGYTLSVHEIIMITQHNFTEHTYTKAVQ